MFVGTAFEDSAASKGWIGDRTHVGCRANQPIARRFVPRLPAEFRPFQELEPGCAASRRIRTTLIDGAPLSMRGRAEARGEATSPETQAGSGTTRGSVGSDPQRGLPRSRLTSTVDESLGISDSTGLPGRTALHPRHSLHDVSRPPVDDAAIRGLRDREGDESAVQVSLPTGERGPE